MGLALTDARPLEKFAVALFWPLGPIAFVVTFAILVMASVIAYPIVGVPVVIMIGYASWMLLR